MKRAYAIVILLVLALPVVAAAGPSRPGPYFSGFIGVNQTDDATLETTDFLFNDVQHFDLEFDPGIYVGGTGGYDFGVVRLEGELSYRDAEIKTISDAVGNRYRVGDRNLGTLAVMFNCFLDLENASPLTPYLGAGVGFATLTLYDDVLDNNGDPIYYEDSATTGAFQVGAGLEIALNPRFSIDLGYRYFKTGEATFDDTWRLENEIELESHNFAVGFRGKF